MSTANSTSTGAGRRWAGRLRLGDLRPRPLPAARTLLLSLAFVLVGLVLVWVGLGWPDATARVASTGHPLPWWELAPGFALAGIFVFHVEIKSEAHTFSVSEMPLVLGLMFSTPRDLILARLLGEVLVLVVYERQALTKLVFNIGVFFAESTLALTCFHWLAVDRSPVVPTTWLAAWAAAGVASFFGASAVWLVIRLHAGQADLRRLISAAAITTTCNVSLAIVAAVLLSRDPVALVPLGLIAAVLVTAYRGYTRLTRHYDGLQLLYQFTRITSGHHRPADTLNQVLDEASKLLRARRAIIALFHPGATEPWLLVDTADTAAIGRPTDPGAGAGAGASLPAELRRRVVLAGESLFIPSTTKGEVEREILTALDVHDALAAPLRTGGEVTGLLLVADRLGAVSTFEDEDARLFTTLASQAAIALANGHLIERLHEQVKAREHEAMHDALTGLPNRTLLGLGLESALARPDHPEVGVLLLDLDGFKEINDTLGHHTGDQVLREVAERLREAVGDHGLVARLGGDEFAVVLPVDGGVALGLEVALRIKAAIRRPIQLSTLSLEVGASIGVVSAPEHGDDPSTLLQRADIAMYSAKRGRSGVAAYDPALDWHSERRLRLALELRATLSSNQLEVYYQPIARALDGQVVSAEALARWQHPELGPIGPDEFIPIAERSGLIHDLTYYVLDRALAQVRAWNAAGLDLSVAVNLSVHVLRDADWPVKVAELLVRHRVPAHQLKFEITESSTFSDPDTVIRLLNEMARSGVTFSIDDFGTGYSSLAYLQRLPVAEVKIDKSFVIPMAADAPAASIVRSVIDLARNLGLQVVAEGVEDQRTLDLLSAMECTFVQGYYLSRPIPGTELTEWMTARRERSHARVRRLRSTTG